MNKLRVIDIFLLPRSWYERLNSKVFTLYIGIFVLGMFDLVLPISANLYRMFWKASFGVAMHNFLIAVLLSILLGLIDVVFFSLPLFDLFKFFKKGKIKDRNNDLLIKFMKAYIISHAWMIVTTILLLLAYYIMGSQANNNFLIYIIIMVYCIVPLWFVASVTRGVDCIYNFERKLRPLVFISVLSWVFLLQMAMGFMMEKWFILLFR